MLRETDWTFDATAEFLTTGSVEATPFDRAVLTWNGTFPEGSQGRFELRVRRGEAWSEYVPLGEVRDGHFRSVPSTPADFVRVDVDTLVVDGDGPADAFQVRARLTGGARLRSLGVAHYRARGDAAIECDRAPSKAWGVCLDVPRRSQRDEAPAIAARICSPTSAAMALEYFGYAVSPAAFAALAYDPASDLYGNWSVNASRVGEILGEAFVARFTTMGELEAEIAAGRPVVLSHAWRAGDLTGAPLTESAGHLVVVVGFTDHGDVIVNDPAADRAAVRRTYARQELFRTWQGNANGIVYVFRPSKVRAASPR